VFWQSLKFCQKSSLAAVKNRIYKMITTPCIFLEIVSIIMQIVHVKKYEGEIENEMFERIWGEVDKCRPCN
jgi:hypothetical protein